MPVQTPAYFHPQPYLNLPHAQIIAPGVLPPFPYATQQQAPPSVQPEAAVQSNVPSTSSDTPSASLTYQWPDGTVKLECTVGQEPVGWNDQGWKWRSSGARRNGVPENALKVNKRYCLGVFHCSCIGPDGLPRRFFRPKNDAKARGKQHNETCHICHSTLVYVSCDCTLIYYQYKDDDGTTHAVRHHIGRHSHARPPLKQLAAREVEALDLQVRQNPQSTAQQMRAGADKSQVPLGEIATLLLDPRKARSEVDKSKVRQGIIDAPATRLGGFQFLSTFRTLKESFEVPWITDFDFLNREFVCMQTPFMRDVLLRESVESWHAENLQAESGRHGVITDGTHDFFDQGILLTSLVFSQVVLRWVVVMYTWIGMQDTDHHRPHFKQLIQVIAEICTQGLRFTFDDRLFSAILDFSNAQRNGFIEAFVEFMCSRIPGWNELTGKSQATERTNLRTRAEGLLIGCKVHWRRTLHKIRQLINPKDQYRFDYLIAMLEASSTTGEQFLQAVANIHREFPEVRPWLSWWILPGNGGMIFPAMQKMSAELRAQLPSSTNGAESGHNLLYGAAGKHHDLWEGIRRLYRVSRETEMLHEAVLNGHVQAKFQGQRPQSMSRVGHTWYENDGRAPDTRARLEAVTKLEAELLAQKASLSESERFASANAKKPAASASNTSNRTIDQRLLQSYKWDANSCFIDATMEVFFRAFTSMSDTVRGDLLRRIRAECPNTGLQDVFEHFYLRGLHSGAITVGKPTKDKNIQRKLILALDAGQRNVKRLIQTKWDGGQFVDGMPGCARTWPTQMVQVVLSQTDTTLRVKQYFGTRYKLKFVCTSNHVTEKVHASICFETCVVRDDLKLAHAHLPTGSDQPSLADLLAHSIPRERYGTARSHSPACIHDAESSSICDHPSCDGSQSSLTSITTEWPLILRVMPICTTIEGDIVLKDVYCPLTMHLGSEVEYELIARVIYSGPRNSGAVGHYTTQIRIGDRAYIYNDLLHDGLLTELGPVHLLEEYNPNVAYVVYLRRSRPAVGNFYFHLRLWLNFGLTDHDTIGWPAQGRLRENHSGSRTFLRGRRLRGRRRSTRRTVSS
ncbi:hypothetical protein C8R43DRAFT_902422 [Mycena crocata]|nr:hypothetical protein C8R43DRAFT_902422 [Mycena crocata]